MGYRTYTCPIARQCGGCEWLSVPYPIQLKRKQEAIAQLFGDLAQADGCEISTIVGMDEPRAYRYKAATPFAPGTRGRIRSGFFAQGTHRIVPCAECLVEELSLRPILNSVARVAERVGVSAYHEDKGSGLLRHAIVRKAMVGGEILLTIVTNGNHIPQELRFVDGILSAHPEITTIVQNVNTRRTNAMLGSRNNVLYGKGIIHDSLLGCTFELGATSFYQTNPSQTEKLYALAIKSAQLEPGMRLLDAYCGTGTIGLCAAHSCKDLQLVGVERGEEAIVNAKRNARANHLEQAARFVRADATEYLAGSKRSNKMHSSAYYDVIMLDPPRAGSTPEFLSAASACNPKRIVYISCNPQTQARDLWFLRQKGWKLDSLTPVDMFPHTKHVETVVSMSKE
ncbi:23S rRNA (uracil(1939)-C(5))-methyltransferase RlmD [Atopobium fossor]|uniref:23S rRNA (uracil(1939)-C(5))-methyltransferase RlmD n=1 Tax=Atopobium fossor TaxID=39487 RepID=UPI0003FACE44|nr:23S rRNA (uracil(1939)-C(5))-methyltransferase RlmD [Atopobium fossor]